MLASVPEECCEERQAWEPGAAPRTDPQGLFPLVHHQPSPGEVQRERAHPLRVEFPAQARRQDPAGEPESRPSQEEARWGYPAAALDPGGP